MISLNARLEPDLRMHSHRRSYRATALDRYRGPLPGVAIELALDEGCGAFDEDASRIQVELTTDEAGDAYFDWYRPSVDEASVNLRLTCRDERAVDVELEPQIEMPWI